MTTSKDPTVKHPKDLAAKLLVTTSHAFYGARSRLYQRHHEHQVAVARRTEINGVTFGALEREVMRLAGQVTHAEDQRAAAMAELTRVRRSLDTLLAEGSDRAGRRLVAKLLRREPFDGNCMIGPNGCEAHFHEKGDCTVAWLKSWVAGHVAQEGGVALAYVMTDRAESRDIIVQALEEYLAVHELEGAMGTHDEAVTARSSIRLARDMLHAAKSGL